MKRYAITIDPSIRSVGVALWSWTSWEQAVPPIKTELWKATASELRGSWQERANAMGMRFKSLLDAYENPPHRSIELVGCELPSFFQSAGGHMVAASGDLGKLQYVVGLFAGVALARGVPFQPVPVNEWKGQMSKEAVIHRICKRLGGCVLPTSYNQDEWDAVGIGLYLKGVMV